MNLCRLKIRFLKQIFLTEKMIDFHRDWRQIGFMATVVGILLVVLVTVISSSRSLQNSQELLANSPSTLSKLTQKLNNTFDKASNYLLFSFFC